MPVGVAHARRDGSPPEYDAGIAIVLGLLCSLAWGLADFRAGVESRRRPLLAVLVVSQTTALAAATILALATSEPIPSATAVGRGLLAGLLLITAIAAFYRALSRGLMGVVAPIMATSAGIPVVVGLAQGERLSAVQAGGILLCGLGVVLVTRQPAEGGAQPGGGARWGGGVGFALVGMLAFGTFLVEFEDASSEALFWTIVSTRVTAVAVVGAAMAVTGFRPEVPARAVPAIAAIGLLDIAGLSMFAVAADDGLLSVVAVLASLFPAVTVLLARWLLEERLARPQVWGIVTALVGVAALAVP